MAKRARSREKPQASLDKKRSRLVVLGALGLFVASAIVMMPYIPDDAYISFRYAEHLADGHGLTFNVGEPPVEAYSNLLWILILGVLYKIGFGLPTVAPLVCVILGALNVVLLYVLYEHRRLPALQMLLPMLLFASSGPFLMYAVSGMETAIFAILLLASLYFVDQIIETSRMSSYVGVSVCSVLLMMTRPEGIVLFPVVAIFLLINARSRSGDSRKAAFSWKRFAVASVIFIASMVIYNVWRVSYFGEWLPTPFLSKAGGGASLLQAWSSNVRMYFVRGGYEYPPHGYYFLALTFLAILGAYLLPSVAARKPTDRLAVLVVVVYGLIYFNFVDWMPGMRYHAPLVGLLFLPAVHVQSAFFKSKRLLAAKPAQVKFAAVVLACVLVSYSGLVDLKRVGQQVEGGNRRCLVALGKWLAEAMPSSSLLAMSDVGATPYYSRLRTLDINRESLTDIHIAKNGFSEQYVIDRRPDVVVLVSRGVYIAKMDSLHAELIKRPDFDELYRFLATVRYQWYDDRSYWIYVGREMPPIRQELIARLPKGIGHKQRIEAE